MKLIRALPAGFVLVASVFQVYSLSPADLQAPITFSTEEQIKADFESVPCKNEARLDRVKLLFEKMGASPSDISIEKFKDVENVVVRKQGQSDDRIVIGAHYDKTGDGCGAVDNWSGVVTLAHLYRTVKAIPLKKTLIFVAFGKEELGLVGSRAMVSAIPKEELVRYCAMVNIDSLGLGAPQVADNQATTKLKKLAENTAKNMKMPFGHAVVLGDSDSSSFSARNIPALTIHGLSDEYRSLLHSPKDTAAKVNPTSVYLGYRLALAMIASISSAPCDAFK